MTVVHPYAWKASSEYEEESAVGGYYSVCLDNQFSRFSAKLVNLYLTTFRYDEWEKFSQELQDMDITVENFTMALKTVDQRIQVFTFYKNLSEKKTLFTILDEPLNFLVDNAPIPNDVTWCRSKRFQSYSR